MRAFANFLSVRPIDTDRPVTGAGLARTKEGIKGRGETIDCESGPIYHYPSDG